MALWIGCVAMPAVAATAHQKEEARAHMAQGTTHYNLGEFKAALKSYQEAYRLTNAPALLFNIGQCLWKLGDDRAAVHSYRAYLRNGTDPANRRQVEERIAELEKRIKATEAGETVRETGGRPGPAGAAEDRVAKETVAPEDGKGAAETVTASGTAAKRAAADLNRPVPVATPKPMISTEPAPGSASDIERTGRIYTRWWFWAAVGGAVAAGIATALLLSSGSNDPSCPMGASCK